MSLTDRGHATNPGQPAAGSPASEHGHPVRRRALLAAGGAGAALIAASPLYLLGRGNAATTPAAAPPQAAKRQGVPGLHGATLSRGSFPPGVTLADAIQTWERMTGTKLQAWKVYYQRDHFPTQLDPITKALAEAGVKALLCFKPDFLTLSKTQLARLSASVTMFRKSGLKADVAIWQEPQVDKGHPSPQHFIRAVKYYGPAVREHYPLVYDASGHAGPTGWVKYYPGDDSIDKVAVDFYAHHFATGERIEAIAALADKASPAKPFGVWEMGDRSAHAPKPPPAQVRAYFSYLESFMSQRLADGKTNADMAWYDAGASAIRSASDFRAPLWHKLVTATS